MLHNYENNLQVYWLTGDRDIYQGQQVYDKGNGYSARITCNNYFYWLRLFSLDFGGY
jgi:hypothetical protein